MPEATTAIMRDGEERVLFELFSAVRSEELGMTAWDAQLRDRILRMQFTAQRRSYHEQYPGIVERFIVRDGTPIGWMMIDDSGEALCCVDLAIMPAERRKGIATGTLRALQEEAAATDRPLVLSVLRLNAAALSLYDRLGFRPVGGNDSHVLLEWRQTR